jgi:regulatory protein RepA
MVDLRAYNLGNSAPGAEADHGKANGSAAPETAQNQFGFWWEDSKVQLDLAREKIKSASSPHERNEALKDFRELTERMKADLVFSPTPVTDAEWYNSKATRPPVVDCWYYQDVGHLASPGGVGKTTLNLFIAIQMVLNQDVFGYNVENCGPVVFLTGEDDRGTLMARLRYMCEALTLTPGEISRVREFIGKNILDVSGLGIKLTKVEKDTVVPSDQVPRLIEKLKPIQPSMFFVDPAVSFGIGESRVNDAEQGLIDAGRRIRNEVACGVFYSHHTGKVNGREKALDQYAGRGGSALADGSRMVHVMQSLTPDEWEVETGNTLEEGEAGLVYARPKITWAPPNQPHIYIKRQGYLFTRHDHIQGTEGAKAAIERNAEKIDQFLREAWPKNDRYTKGTLDKLLVVKPREAQRAAVEHLLVQGRLSEEDGPSTGGRPPKLLRPIGGS